MALRYYPLSRIITNQYTRGNEYLLPDGRPYTGRYYTTYNGEAYTGVNPTVGTNILLLPSSLTAVERYVANTGTRPSINSFRTQPVTANEEIVPLAETTKLTELKPYYPIPIESDYQRGYFTRYFAKTVSGPGYVFEISNLDWSKIQDGDIEQTALGYESIDMFWQLTGPLNDRRISQYQIQGGVFDTNKRVTETKSRVFRGLLEFIGGDYTKFARITP